MVDQKVEIELALKDSSSDAIQQIAKSVSEVVKQIGEMGKASDGNDSGIKKTIEGAKKLKDKTDDSSKSFTAMYAILSRLAGPAGVAIAVGTGLVAAALALDKLAGDRLRFEHLSTDLGLSTDEMSVIIRTFEKLLGASPEAAKDKMIEIATVLRGIQTYGASHPVFQALSEMGRGEFATGLIKISRGANGVYNALEAVNAEYNKILTEEGPQAALIFLDTVHKGWGPTIAKGFAKAREGVKPARQIDLTISEKFRQNRQDLTEATMDFLTRWQEFFEVEFNEFSSIAGRLSGMGAGAWSGVLGGQRHMFDPQFDAWRKDPLLADPPSALKRKGHRFEFEKEEDETKKDTNSTLERMRDSIKNLFGFGSAKQFGGSVEAGQNYLVGEAGPEFYIGGGESQIVGDSGPSIIQLKSPGMIMAGGMEDRMGGGFPQFMPNIHTPQSAMPPFEERFGDWNSKGFSDRFGDWDSKDFGERYGDWSTSGGGTRPTEGDSTPNWKGGDWQGGGVSPSMGPDMSSIERRQLDIMLSEESGEASSLNADITFKNVPPGVMTKADGDGFDNFKVNKSRALEDINNG